MEGFGLVGFDFGIEIGLVGLYFDGFGNDKGIDMGLNADDVDVIEKDG